MVLTDEIPDADYEKYGARILLAQGLLAAYNDGKETVGPDEGTDGKKLTCVLYDGYNTYVKSAIIWTVYPKEKFEEGVEYFTDNTASVSVIGWDDQWDGSVYSVDWENNVTLREGLDYTVTGEDANGNPIRERKIVKTLSTSAKARMRLPISYKVMKEWDDDDNVNGNRPSGQSVRIYRDGSVWAYITLNEENNWTYTWSDGGQPHTYSVDEYGMASGYTRKIYEPGDEDYDPVPGKEGQPYKLYSEWYYSLKNKTYDYDTHTWTFTNKYNVSYRRFYVIPFDYPDPPSMTVWKSANNYVYNVKNDSHDHLLNDLKRGNTVLLPFTVSLSSYIMRMTYEGDAPWELDTIENIFNPANYNKKDVKIELEDTNLTMRDLVHTGLDARPLQAGDYDIASVSMYSADIYAWTQPDEIDENGDRIINLYESWYYKYDSEKSRSTPVTLYGRSMDENGEWGEWIVYAVGENGRVTAQNGASGYASTRYVTDGYYAYAYNITLPKGVHQVKTSAVSHDAYIKMQYSLNVRLYPNSEQMQDIIDIAFGNDSTETYAWTSIVNESRGYASTDMDSDYEHAEVKNNRSAIEYLHGRNFRNAVYLEKSYTSYTNDEINERMEFTNKVTLTSQSNVPSDMRSVYNELIADGTLANTESGTFYELLPEGVSIDVDSITVDGSTDNVTEVYTLDNYKLSGRTLVIIRANLRNNVTYVEPNSQRYYPTDYAKYAQDPTNFPATGYKNTHTMTYKSYMPYSEVLSRMVNGMVPLLVNAVAYEADEDVLGTVYNWRGEPDDPTAGQNKLTLSQVVRESEWDLREVLTDLDPARDDPNFVYATAYTDITGELFSGSFQGEKHVSIDGIKWENGITKNVTVYEGSTYTYRVSVVVEKGKSASNIIFYDPFETAEPQDPRTCGRTVPRIL